MPHKDAFLRKSFIYNYAAQITDLHVPKARIHITQTGARFKIKFQMLCMRLHKPQPQFFTPKNTKYFA